MSIKPQDAQYLTDPRTETISEVTGADVEAVVETAEELSAEFGDSVSDELDTGVAVAEAFATDL